MLKSIAVSAAVVLLALAGPVGCAAHHDAPASAEAKGSLSLALSATGPDGAKYVIGDSEYLLLSSPSNPSFGSWGLGLAGDTPTQSYQVPTGSYDASLQGGTTVAGVTTYTLVRTAPDGSTTNVEASLVDVNDFKFQVFQSQVTSLIFHFSVPGLGDITFSTGSLQLGVSVAQTNGPGTGATASADATVYAQSLGGDPAVDAVLAAPSGTASPLAVRATFTGTWAPSLNSICATAKFHVTTTATNPGILALAGEIDGGDGQVCVGDAQTGNSVTMFVSRYGLPQSAGLTGLIATQSTFQGDFFGQLPAGVYDDHTFSPGKLSPAVTLPYMSGSFYIFGSDGTRITETDFDASGKATFAIDP